MSAKQKKYMNKMEFNVGTKIYGTWASAVGSKGGRAPPLLIFIRSTEYL